MSKTIYTVWSPEGEAPPKATHTSHKEAFAVAHMMAERHPGQTFFVMKTASRPIAHEQPAEIAA